MRAWLVVVGLVAVVGDARAEAEHYEQVRVDAGMTGSSVAVSDRNGVGFVAEIKVNAHDNVAVVGRVEISVMFGGLVDDEELGAGVYSMGSHTIVSDPDGSSGISTTTGRYFGVAPEVGVDLGRVRLAVTYNAIVGAGVERRQTTGGVEHRETLSQNYLSLELSFRFGGGRLRAPR